MNGYTEMSIKIGYRFDNSMLFLSLNCADINECAEGLDDCDDNADCINLVGSFQCVCWEGFTGDGKECLMTEQQRDECAEETDTCSQNADCTDREVGYDCQCRNGFTGDGKVCQGMSVLIALTSVTQCSQ